MCESELLPGLKDKLEKSGRKWKPSSDYIPYSFAELFCEKCGKSLGLFDIGYTDIKSNMYCDDCVKPYIRNCPISLPGGAIIADNGNSVIMRYENDYYPGLELKKICYFNKKGRYVKIKGRLYYI